MKTLNSFILIFCCCLLLPRAEAQSFSTKTSDNNNNPVQANLFTCGPSEESFRFIENGELELAASIWSNNTIDLNESFELTFSFRFSIDDEEDEQADGICFVLQNEGTMALGQNGGNLGVHGTPSVGGPNVVVEFDVFDNVNNNGASDLGDAAAGGEDHIALSFNSDIENPVELDVLPNIEDAIMHDVIVHWDACEYILSVTLDGVEQIRHQNNLVANIFNGSGSNVTWGFTAATGTYSSDHDICIGLMRTEPCNLSSICTQVVDLISCEETGDFGYVFLNCPGATFEWAIPKGTTAVENSTTGTSFLSNLSPGLYTVKVTMPDGTIETSNFEVIEDCPCTNPPEPCEITAPTNLNCTLSDQDITLIWDAVPGAVAYEVLAPHPDVACQCGGGSGGGSEASSSSVAEIITMTNEYVLPPHLEGACFAWAVRAICSNGNVSPYSTVRCYDRGKNCLDINPRIGADTNNPLEGLQIYPNPAKDNITIEYTADELRTLSVNIYAINGKLVKSIAAETFSGGYFKKELDLEALLENGLYIFEIETNLGSYQEKILISK